MGNDMTTCTICGSVLTVLTSIVEEVQTHECMTCGASFDVEILLDDKLEDCE